MTAFNSSIRREFCPFRIRFCLLLAVLAGLLTPQVLPAQDPDAEARPATLSRLLSPIDEHALVTLQGNVRADLTKDKDLGAVDDGMPLRLYLVLQRSPAQQADLENLLARQQQRTAGEYHKWLTPKAFGARFGASTEDLAKLTGWLESHGLKVRSVLNNASIIDFEATAGQVRDTFHAQLHYFDIQGGKYAANVQDPQIPAALAPVVAGIQGLDKIPPAAHHTKARSMAYDAQSHRWVRNQPDAGAGRPEFYGGPGTYNVTPQDLYTIYNVKPVLNGGELASHATVAVIEESDIQYGTVDPTTGVATGGDVATFRSLFGVAGTLNMHVYHGYGSVTCNDPGVDPNDIEEDIEASLDAEWINATAPSANLIFMSCPSIFDSLAALVDNNLADAMSMSYGSSELNFVGANSGFYAYQDTFYAQAASQGQSIFISSGDSGSDTADQDTHYLATSGINVSAFLSPLVTATGGTDFSDQYDYFEGGAPQETYWADSNLSYYGDALGYVPETSWNDSCISSLYIALAGETGLGLCDELPTLGYTNDGTVVGGGGGISTHYPVPAYQTGISGYSGAYRSDPDIAGFASSGFWGHSLIFCDSNSNYGGSVDCSSSSTFGGAGGTSFVAPYMAGVAGLLVDYTGSRQGLLNPTLYALAKAQYTAVVTETACYSNGQTNNF
ncbi:MAG: protease pro-enzyme activation domain-containing protein, partial [Terracidiphilus sp.]